MVGFLACHFVLVLARLFTVGKIEQSFVCDRVHLLRRPAKLTIKQLKAVRCPTCGAKLGERGELATGQPCTFPHRERRLVAADLGPKRGNAIQRG